MNARKVEKLISSRKVSIVFFFSAISSVIIVLNIKQFVPSCKNNQYLATYYFNLSIAFQAITILAMTGSCMRMVRIGFSSITLWDGL
jgi:hypothetical protein